MLRRLNMENLPKVLTTEEFALAVKASPQTIRKNYCLNGECYGIRPIKIGNRLLWKYDEVKKLLA